VKLAILVLLAATLMPAADYTARQTTSDGIIDVVLTDTKRNQEARIAPELGNNAYEYKVNGKRVLWSPYQTLKEFKDKPTQVGNPFLAPWANRMKGEEYFVNGKKYVLNPNLGNYRPDGNKNPIHGLIVFAKWSVVKVHADNKGAYVTSRLEFWKNPQWMAQFPFAHTYEMTYRLANGMLECETKIDNHSTEAMPVAIGFHTYYTLHDAPRDEWTVHLPAKDRVVADAQLIPTGERKPNEVPAEAKLRDYSFDDGFTTLERDAQGRAVFWVKGKQEKISVLYGPNYPVSVVWAPKGRGQFICFEPMAGVTNAINLGHAGKYPDLQKIAAGGVWKESFWVKPEGF
jgi:aldose 1-epimerase